MKISNLLQLLVLSSPLLMQSASYALTISLPGNGSYEPTGVLLTRSLTYDYNGGSETIYLSAVGNSYKDFDGNGSISGSWLSWSKMMDSTGDMSRGKLTVDKNMSVYERSGSFSSYVSWSWGDGQVAIDIQQSGTPVTVLLNGQLDNGIEGGTGSFRIETIDGAAWHIDSEWVSGDETDWITFSKTSGTGNDEVSFDVKSSVLCRPRSAKIVVASKEFVFTQTGNLSYDGEKGVIAGPVTITTFDFGSAATVMYVDGDEVVSTDTEKQFTWQPLTLGAHTLSITAGRDTWSSVFNVIKLDFRADNQPNPPMAKNNSIGITPLTQDVDIGGGMFAVVTSGSGTWTAAVSEPWITLNAASGQAGYPVAYLVTASTNVGERVGYVYVSGHVHTVKQVGYPATVSPTSVEYEHQGG
ncbi:MAG: hypothetical protein MJZ55_05695, partial [Paludibacteraceae bacterium]|nr:hypothetical protein [Paludibacteraceae bacterium]